MSIKDELAAATEPMLTVPARYIYPSLAMRLKLAQFAVENGLRDEDEALAVVASRYFRMAESEKFAGWFIPPEES